MVATVKPDLTRVWANGAPGANVIDPDTTTPGKFDDGWLAEVPPFEHFNFLQKLFTQGLAHNNEQGIDVWDTVTDYPIDGLSKGSDGIIYISIVTPNIANDPIASPTDWVSTLTTELNVDSITDLRLTPGGNGKQKVFLKSYYTPDFAKANPYDGGGGDFLWDSTSTETDDGGITIKVTALTTGRWIRILSGRFNIKWFGATGDGITNDTTEIELALSSSTAPIYTPFGIYLVDDDVDVTRLYGEGTIEKSWGSFELPRIENSFKSAITSKIGLGAASLNPRGFWTDGRHAYIATQGSYAGSTQSELHIISVQNPLDIKKISSFNLGAVGVRHRSLTVSGNYVYCCSDVSGGTCRVIDITDKTTPVEAATFTLGTGGLEYLLIAGDILICPKWSSNGIEFYSLRDPLVPELISILTLTSVTYNAYEPVLNGNLLWLIADTDGLAGNQNLFCIDISDINAPVEVSSYLIAGLVFSRRFVIKGNYIFVGGFGAASRLRVIDISDPTTPTLVYTAATELGGYTEICGDYLLTYSASSNANVWDIRQPEAPILVAANLTTIGSRPQLFGAYVLSYTSGDGVAGPDGADGNYNPFLQITTLSTLSITGATIGSLVAQDVFTEKLAVVNEATFGSGIIVGPAGIHSHGPLSAKGALFNGIIANTLRTFVSQVIVNGDISAATKILDVFQLSGSLHQTIRIKYFLIYDQSQVGAAAVHSIGEQDASISITGAGAINIELAFAARVTHRDSGGAQTVAFTLVAGTGTDGTPMQIKATSAALNIANSRAVFEISIEGFGSHRAELP